MNKRLVLFDFDGTLTTRDTLLAFILFSRGLWRTSLGFIILSPYLVAWKAGILNNQKAKERVLRYFFQGELVSKFNARATEFATQYIPQLIRKNAIKLIDLYKTEGVRIVVVSASPENWVKPWCDLRNLQCIATKLVVEQNVLTGTIAGQNCYGPEKERRIRQLFSLNDYSTIIAYGDSRGDKEMLALAHEAHYGEL